MLRLHGVSDTSQIFHAVVVAAPQQSGRSGSLEFLGRMDSQIKIRGYRVEVGEVESAINGHPDVASVLVTPEDTTGSIRLHAYVVPRLGATPRPSDLNTYLKQSSPAHFTPAAYTFLRALPVLPNGKLDRTALLQHASDVTDECSEPALAELESSTQEEIAALWREVLKVPRVGVDDSFFDLGGHSLLLIGVYRRLSERFRGRLTIVDLFRYPTVRSLASFLDRDDEIPSAAGGRL